MKRIFNFKNLCRVLTLLLMAAIFLFSSRDGAESYTDSSSIGIPFTELLKIDYTRAIDYILRKCAHFTEYALLGMLILASLSEKRKVRARILPAWITAALYAASDEFHQLFVPGRSGMLRDVALDSAGALCGVLLAALIAALYRRKRRNRIKAALAGAAPSAEDTGTGPNEKEETASPG